MNTVLSAAVVGATFLATVLVGVASGIAAIVLVPLTSTLLAVLGMWVSCRLMAAESDRSMWPYAMGAWVLPVVLGTFVLINTWAEATQVTAGGAAAPGGGEVTTAASAAAVGRGG